MMTGGTSDRSPAEVRDLLEDRNSYGTLTPTVDIIYGEVEFPDNHRDAVLPVLSELFRQPTFDEAWVERTRADRIADLEQVETPLAQRLFEASRHAILGDRRQTDWLNGADIAAFETVTTDDLRRWHRRSFAAPPLAIVVTGPVDAGAAGTAIDALLPPPTEATPPPQGPAPMQFSSKPVYLHQPSAEKSIIAVIGPLPATTDGMDALDIVAARLFAGGAGSPLFERIRADLGATYGMSMEIANYSRSQRILAISGEIDSARMAEVREAVLDTYAEFRDDPDTDLLQEVSTRLADDIRRSQSFVNSSARIIRELALDGRDLQSFHTLADDVEAVTDEMLRDRLTTEFPEPGALAVFGAGPDPSVFPDACVVTEPAQAAECP
jgi:zinc protease